jgi:hypothetical protein
MGLASQSRVIDGHQELEIDLRDVWAKLKRLDGKSRAAVRPDYRGAIPSECALRSFWG